MLAKGLQSNKSTFQGHFAANNEMDEEEPLLLRKDRHLRARAKQNEHFKDFINANTKLESENIEKTITSRVNKEEDYINGDAKRYGDMLSSLTEFEICAVWKNLKAI